jgi:predicted small lipoprotein YifL
MSLPLPVPGRTVLLAGLIVLAVAACGRRGPLEAPLTSAEIAAQQQGMQARQQQAATDDEDEVGNAGVLVPTPTPTRRRSRAYTIPQEPFVLDPLL